MNGQEEFTITTESPEDTEAFAARLASLLSNGGVIALRGGLAAGKTCFVRGLARALGATEHVHSPTFTLVNEYATTPALFHLDLYRLSGPHELIELGYDEIFDGGVICAVEWAERGEALLPAQRLEIALEQAGGDARSITITNLGLLGTGWQDALRAGPLA